MPWETLRALVAAAAPDDAGAQAEALLARLGRGAIRDIWLSAGSPVDPFERILGHAALAGGWAVLREPADPIPASTLLWARPTLVSGRAAELAGLLDAAAAEAPRWRARRWLRRRLARLRALVVRREPGGASDLGIDRLADRLAAADLDVRRLVVELEPTSPAGDPIRESR